MVWYTLPTFVFFMWMCFKLHLRTIYCDKSTVEETRHLNCARFERSNTSTISKVTFETHT